MTEDTTPDGLAGGDDDEVVGDRAPAKAGWRKVAGVAAAAVVAIGGGVWGATALLSGDNGAISPSASVSRPSLTANPSASPWAGFTAELLPEGCVLPGYEVPTGSVAMAAPGEVTVDESLPSALTLPEGIWDQTEPGWVLAVYRPSLEWSPQDQQAPCRVATRQVVYLVSPEGIRYQVLELDPSEKLELASWSAGNSSAVAYRSECRHNTECDGEGLVRLDLVTGEQSIYETPFDATPYSMGTLADGRIVWSGQIDGSSAVIFDDQGDLSHTVMRDRALGYVIEPMGGRSSDGEWQIWEDSETGSVGAISLETGAFVPAEQMDDTCFAVTWVVDTQLLYYCFDLIPNPGDEEFYTLDVVDGTVASAEFPEDDLPISTWWIEPGVYVGVSGVHLWDNEYLGAAAINDHGVVTDLALVDATGQLLEFTMPIDVVGSGVYVWGAHNWWPITETLVVYDLDSGDQVVLFTLPVAGPTLLEPGGEGGYPSRSGVSSIVIAQ